MIRLTPCEKCNDINRATHSTHAHGILAMGVRSKGNNMTVLNFIGLSIAILFLVFCFYAFLSSIYKSHKNVIFANQIDSKCQSNRNHHFSSVGAFGGDGGAACADGGGSSCS
jgi:hypothetical protein